ARQKLLFCGFILGAAGTHDGRQAKRQHQPHLSGAYGCNLGRHGCGASRKNGADHGHVAQSERVPGSALKPTLNCSETCPLLALGTGLFNGDCVAALVADVAAVVVGLASVGQQLSLPEWQSCAPATSEARQLAQVVVNYIETHPERMREDFRRGS